MLKNKENMGKTKKKTEPDIKLWTTASPHEGQDIKKSFSQPRAELRPQPQKGSNMQFTTTTTNLS